ncbi:MAG: FecR domain-containing protein [Ginsengibacter sp.]
MMDNTGVDIILITKYLSGEATPGEAIYFDEWIRKPGNRQQFDEAKEMWEMVTRSATHKSPGVAAGWAQLQNSVSEKKSSTGIKNWYRLYAVAAVLVGVIICGVILYNIFNDHKTLSNQKFITLAASEELLKDTLPDGSIIILNRNSHMKFAENFNNTSRHLSLNGEAYFNVAPDKMHPFIINEDGLSIEVVGTSFNVSKKQNPASIVVQVQSGIVKMYTSQNEITISKGQTGIYSHADKALRIEDSVDANSMGYATGTFSFTEASLQEIAYYLEKAFGITILFRNNTLLHCRMTARFENKSLDYIMHVISVTLNIKYTIQKNTINIAGNGCN